MMAIFDRLRIMNHLDKYPFYLRVLFWVTSLSSKMVLKFNFDLFHFRQSLLSQPSPQALVVLQMNGQ